MEYILRGGRVIDPANNIDEVTDVYIENGKIAAFGDDVPLCFRAAEFNAGGMWVCPGFIDMHAHLREPGQTHKETIKTAGLAAAAGGFTAICAMPNTSPPADSAIVIEYIKLKAARDSVVNVLPIGALTKGQAGEDLAEIGLMKEAGAAALSEDGKSVMSAGLMKTALTYARQFGLTTLDHCEDPSLGGSRSSEETMTARDIILARETGAKLHICHVSTAFSARVISMAQKEGVAVSAEVTPHHFALCEGDNKTRDTNFKMSPPLRTKADADAMKDALSSGVISVIATDHAPHTYDEKNKEYDIAPNGVIGLETAVPIGISELVETGVLTPSRFVACFTSNPAGVLNNGGAPQYNGSLSVGNAADITVIDPLKKWVIGEGLFRGKSRNTPFIGRNVTGAVVMTIVGGKTVYSG